MADKTDRYRGWLAPVSPLDAERVWQHIEARIGPEVSRSQRRWFVLAPLMAAAAVIAFSAGYLLVGSDARPERAAALRLANGSSLGLLTSEKEARTLALSDGSRIELAQHTALRTRISTATSFEAELQRGGAVFDVVPHGPRVWTVRAADAQIIVLGTRFSVALADNKLRVAVERGKVQVTSPALPGSRTLEANEALELKTTRPTAHFLGRPPEANENAQPAPGLSAPSDSEPNRHENESAAQGRVRSARSGELVQRGAQSAAQRRAHAARSAASDREPNNRQGTESAAQRRAHAARSAASDREPNRQGTESAAQGATLPAEAWPTDGSAAAARGRELLPVRRGQADGAATGGGTKSAPEVQADGDQTIELWLQRADAARAAGQPGKAASALERAVADHAGDPRAALAAFTLAQLYLEQLAAPLEAAHAFERAAALGLPATLAEEAAARRVEAYARAGQRAQAQRAADAYRTTYPNGSRTAAVTRWLAEQR